MFALQITFNTQALEGYLERVAVDSASPLLASLAADTNLWGTLWTPKERSILSWSIMPKDKTPFFLFFQQSGSQASFHPLCMDACITSVTHEDVYLLIKFEATEVPDYIFTIVFPPNEVRYCHEVIQEHLMGKAGPAQISHIFEKILDVSSPKGFARSFQCYSTNIWKALNDYEGAKGKGKMPVRRGGALALQAGSQSGTAQSGLATPDASPRGQGRKRPSPNPSASGSKKSKSGTGGSALTFMNPTMKPAVSEKEINYEEAKKTLAEYWEKCADCYVLGVDTPPVDVPIDLLDLSESKYVVRALETTGIKHYKNILTNSIDVSSRPTIVIMPKIKEAPAEWKWETLASSCRFRLIDGQHHIQAAKELIRENVIDPKKLTALGTWKAHVVWHTDARIIMDVSAMANKTNNAGTFTPSWATNLMGARSVWKACGCPVKLKKPNRKESKKHQAQRKKYDVS